VFAQDVRFRQALPFGFPAGADQLDRVEQTLGELLDALRTQLSPPALLADAVRRAVSAGMPSLRGHLLDLERVSEVSAGTALRRQPGVRWCLTVEADTVRLTFHNKTVAFPGHTAESLRYLTDERNDVFTSEDISRDLDAPGRVVLLQTLLREGFLTFA
jgi:hypothetical protein